MNDRELKESRRTLSEPIYNLQRMLRNINSGKLIPDGYFDQKTEDAVIIIQKGAGIEPNGEVDFYTFESIRKLNMNGGEAY